MLTVSTQIARGDDLTLFTRMLESVSFADEIIIFNMERFDASALQVFANYRARVINVKTPKVVEHIRTQQVKASQSEWVLIMDYDEIIPAALAREITGVIKAPQVVYSGYYLTRRNFSLGYPLQHGGFGDDQVPRLFYKPDFVSWSKEIHGMPKVKGEFGYLNSPLKHHKDASLAQMVAKTNRYSEVEAQQFFDGGLGEVTTITLVRKTVMEFIRRYLIKRGFLDGRIGLIQAIYQSYSVFLSYAKLYVLQQKGRG